MQLVWEGVIWPHDNWCLGLTAQQTSFWVLGEITLPWYHSVTFKFFVLAHDRLCQLTVDNTLCRHLESPSDMTTATIISRIFANRKAYEDRNAKKVASEQKYYKSKQHITEGWNNQGFVVCLSCAVVTLYASLNATCCTCSAHFSWCVQFAHDKNVQGDEELSALTEAAGTRCHGVQHKSAIQFAVFFFERHKWYLKYHMI